MRREEVEPKFACLLESVEALKQENFYGATVGTIVEARKVHINGAIERRFDEGIFDIHVFRFQVTTSHESDHDAEGGVGGCRRERVVVVQSSYLTVAAGY